MPSLLPSTSTPCCRERPLARSRSIRRRSTLAPAPAPRSTPYTARLQERQSQYRKDFRSHRNSLLLQPTTDWNTSRSTAKAKNKRSPVEEMTSPLAIKLDIRLETGGDVLHMFGGARTGTSYSLPGHVIVTVPSLAAAPFDGSLALRQRLLKSLEITFEGKSEFFDEYGRYTPLRLITVSKHLLTAPTRLASSRPEGGVLSYAHPFDLVIPGWLPPSHISSMTNTSFGLVAKGVIAWDPCFEDAISAPDCSLPLPRERANRSRSPSPSEHQNAAVSTRVAVYSATFSAASAPAETAFPASSSYRQRITRSLVSALQTPSNSHSHPSAQNQALSPWKPIMLLRHRLPSSIDQFNGAPDAQPGLERHYTLKPEAESPSPVECVVSVPEWVDATGGDENLKVSIRLRARSGFSFELANLEESSRVADDMHVESESSPPRRLTRSHVRESARSAAAELASKTHMVELGMEVEETERFTSIPAQSFTSSFPIPDEQPGPSNSSVGPHAFLSPRTPRADLAMLGLSSSTAPLRSVRTKALLLADDGQPRNFQFAGEGLELGDKWRKVNVVLPMGFTESHSPGNEQPQAEMEGPFLRIRHKLKVRVVCRSTLTPGSDTVVILSTPLRFGTAPVCPTTSQLSDGATVPTVHLPAYTQLFHENGEQRDGEPLPMYELNGPSDQPPTFDSISTPVAAALSREGLELLRQPTPIQPVAPDADDNDLMDVDGSGSEDEEASNAGGSSSSDNPSPAMASDTEPMDISPQLPPTPCTPGGRKAFPRHAPFVAGLAL